MVRHFCSLLSTFLSEGLGLYWANMENCCESSARAKIAEKVIAPGPSMLHLLWYGNASAGRCPQEWRTSPVTTQWLGVFCCTHNWWEYSRCSRSGSDCIIYLLQLPLAIFPFLPLQLDFSLLCVEGLLLRLCTGWSIFLSVYQNYRLENCLDTSQRLKAYFYIFQVEWGKITFLGSQSFIRGLLLLCHVQSTYEVSESSSLMFIIRPGPRLCEEVPEGSFRSLSTLLCSCSHSWNASGMHGDTWPCLPSLSTSLLPLPEPQSMASSSFWGAEIYPQGTSQSVVPCLFSLSHFRVETHFSVSTAA